MFTEDYIVGLIDGEGSFTAYVRNLAQSRESTRRTRIEPKFYLKLIEKDKSVLEALKRYFGCGNVYFQRDRRRNHQHCYRYEVSNRKELEEIIIPFFKKHPLHFPSKAKDFKIFCELMEGIRRGEHLHSSGLKNLYRLKQKMH
ncbi:MAG: LAGLIDADG family homing endonuclease [Candidatus Brennerbacteria bacterium]